MSVINGFRIKVQSQADKDQTTQDLMMAACTLLAKRGDERLTFTKKEIEDALLAAATVLDLARAHVVVEERSLWGS